MTPSNSTEFFEDPVAAYSRLAPHYPEISRRRERYLRGVEKIVISQIPQGSQSLLDIGAGDGSRALRIARECGIQNVVLVEPSQEMATPAAKGATVWNIRAEELGLHLAGIRTRQNQQSFDVVACLWNVLGHIRGFENRTRVLRAISGLLAPHGKCFLDVNHRYNLRSYGVFATFLRWVSDSIFYKETNADAFASWEFGKQSISTYGHVFTDREIKELVRAAGLSVEDRIVVDYDTGKVRRFASAGNLLYVFRRSSVIDSASAAHTS